MNCQEVRGSTPLFLSGELQGEERESFSGHLRDCRDCQREIEELTVLDKRLAATLRTDALDTTRLERAVQARIVAAQNWRRLAAVAAAVVLAIAGIYWTVRANAAPQWYADAERDHRVEVVEQQPRRWRSGAAEIEVVAAQHGLTLTQAAALAPAGYTLELAKNCGIAGKRMLHLVFGNGVRKYSVFVRLESSRPAKIHTVRRDDDHVAGFDTGRYRVVVVSPGPAAECRQLATAAAAKL